jgi:TRAP-type C4-dicarboxylate transport system permease small subunit
VVFLNNKNKVLILLGNLDIVVAGVALATLVTLTFMGVVMRYGMNQPFTWLEEVQLWCMVWIVYVAAGAAFRTGNHVAIEMVVDMFPVKIQKVIDILIALVVFFVLSYLFVQSIGYVRLFLMNERTTNMLSIPYSLIYGIVPISVASMVISYIFATYQEIKKIGDVVEVRE